MQGLTDCLEFTVETEEDFSDLWLPTLDLKLHVDDTNQIRYSFYEKPTGSDKCLQSTTALNQNCLMRSMSNEVMRRLSNMSQHVSIKDRVEVLDNFGQKMTNSGHCLDVIRRSLANGLKGHLRKVKRCIQEGKQFHRTAASSSKERRTKKLTQKQSWFKNKQRSEDDENDREVDRSRTGKRFQGNNMQVATTDNHTTPKNDKNTQRQPSTVLFVEYSKGASLQTKVREVVDRLAPLVGFTMRVTERGGTPLGSLLSNKNLWTGKECGRNDCRPCDQSDEKKEDCVRRNILYESQCVQCEADMAKVESSPELRIGGSRASLYVGESSRSLYERTCEHFQAAESEKEESHIFQHFIDSHKGEGKPNFKFKVIKSFKTSLDRQIAEAIRIEMRGSVLNRKGEFNRCSLTRLGVDQKWEQERWNKSWEIQDSEAVEVLGIEESRKLGRGGEGRVQGES